MKFNKNKVFEYGVYVFAGLFYLWLATQIPYTHDDWDWGLQNGIEQLLTANINSRYVGNCIEVIMTRSTFLKTLIMGSVCFAIPFFAVKFCCIAYKRAGNIRIILFLLCNFFLLSMRTEIWQQTYGWIAGFSNFVISALFLIIYLILVSEIFEKELQTKNQSLFNNIGILLLSVAMQLFIENLTVVITVFTFMFVIIYFCKKRRLTGKWISLLVGNCIGTVIMFSSNIYGSLLNTGAAVDNHRQLTFDLDSGVVNIIIGLVKEFVFSLVPDIWENNWILCIAITIVALCILLINRKNIPPIAIGILGIVHVLAIFYFILNFYKHGIFLYSDRFTNYLHALIGLGFFGLIFVDVLILFYVKSNVAWKFLLLWVAAPLVMAPMVAVNTIGPRCFYTSNILLILFLLTLLTEVFAQCNPGVLKTIYVFACVCVICMFIYWGDIYYEIGKINATRYEIIDEAKKSKVDTIVLPKYPRAEYLWFPEPATEERVLFFKEFYEIPLNVNVVFEEIEK